MNKHSNGQTANYLQKKWNNNISFRAEVIAKNWIICKVKSSPLTSRNDGGKQKLKRIIKRDLQKQPNQLDVGICEVSGLFECYYIVAVWVQIVTADVLISFFLLEYFAQSITENHEEASKQTQAQCQKDLTLLKIWKNYGDGGNFF